MPAITVVVPAHNEEHTLPRLLDRLTGHPNSALLEVIVVPNGCTDQTAAVARSYPGVHVIEVTVGSKVAALNAGDEAASGFPRAYVDADTDLSVEALLSLAHKLGSTQDPLTAAPLIQIDATRTGLVSRLFHQIWAETDYVTSGPIGCGVYALNEAAHARLGFFPDVIADDLLVERLAGDDRWIDADHRFIFYAPQTTSDLLARLTRATLGNLQLEDRFGYNASTNRGSNLLRSLATKPWRWPALAVYLGLRLEAGRRAGRRLSKGEFEWSRDESTRG